MRILPVVFPSLHKRVYDPKLIQGGFHAPHAGPVDAEVLKKREPCGDAGVASEAEAVTSSTITSEVHGRLTDLS